jgi:hypothetical protein
MAHPASLSYTFELRQLTINGPTSKAYEEEANYRLHTHKKPVFPNYSISSSGYVNVITSCGSSVSIVSGYRLEDRGSIPGKGNRFFPLASVFRPALRQTQLPTQWVPEYFPRGKVRPGRDADHSSILCRGQESV